MRNVRVLLAAGVMVAAGVTVSITDHVNSGSLLPTTFDGAVVGSLTCPGLSQHLGDDVSTFRAVNLSPGTRTLVASVDGLSPRRTWRVSATSGWSTSIPTTGSMTTLRADVYGGEVAGALYGGGQLSPCSRRGVSDWWVSGVSTLAQQSATLILANPAATPAVVTVTGYVASGVVSPDADQGLTIPGGDSTAINISSQLIGEANAALHVQTAAGRVVARLIEGTPGGSLHGILVGGDLRHTFAWGNVPTSGIATINGFNPGNQVVSVSATVLMAGYDIAPVTVTAYPHSAFSLPVIPSTGVPSAGLAAIELRATGSMSATLRDGATPTALVASSGTPLTSGSHLVINAGGLASGALQIVGGGEIHTRAVGAAHVRFQSSTARYRVSTMSGAGSVMVLSAQPVAVFFATGVATAEVALDGR